MICKKLILSIIILLLALPISSQDCNNSDFNNGVIGTVDGVTGQAAPFCSDTGIVFCNSLLLQEQGIIEEAVSEAQAGPDYGCLGSEPFPSWFFIRIDEPGNLNLTISQFNTSGTGIDVDFIIWGAFDEAQINDIQAGDTSLLNTTNIRDCSYLPYAVEFLSVNPVLSGEYYIILITNYNGNAGTIEMVSTNPTDLGSATTDCSIIAGDLGPDQDICGEEIVILDGTPDIGNPADYTYQWFLDTGTGFNILDGETNATLTIGTPAVPAISGTYRILVQDVNDEDDEDEVVITFYPQPTIGTPVSTTFEQCDTDTNQDGFFTFDLAALFGNDLLNGQDPTIFEVAFYNSQNDADANANPLDSNNYTNSNPYSTDEIFARIFLIETPDSCPPVTTSFYLQVLQNPDIIQPTDYELCDDDSDGDETNGITQNFILSTKDSEILGPAQDPADFTVTYYESQDDANNDLNPIDQINPYTNTTANSQPIFVRVTNNTSLCFTVSQGSLFNLVVHPLPVIVANPALLQVCDTDLDGIASFDLTTANPKISADFINETFKYYLSEADAENEINAITNAANYTNAIANNDTVWARTTTTYGCFKVSQVNLEVSCVTVPLSFQ